MTSWGGGQRDVTLQKQMVVVTLYHWPDIKLEVEIFTVAAQERIIKINQFSYGQ